MKIQSVAILGAGAVGCYVLWGLADKAAANALQLGVVAEGSRAERLRQNGCTINGQVYHPQVWTLQQAHGVDLLIVALKYGALPGALDSIRTIVSERTVVMSLMNGVDSEDLIAAQVGAAHVLPALIKVASHRTGDGVRFDPETTIGIIYGELTAPFDSDRVQAVRALFADTGIHFRVTEHIREEIWSKFRLNVCNNLPQAILGAGVGCYSDSAHIKAISDGLRREAGGHCRRQGDRPLQGSCGLHPRQHRAANRALLHPAGPRRRAAHRNRYVLRCAHAHGARVRHPDALQRIHLPHDQGSGGEKRRPV